MVDFNKLLEKHKMAKDIFGWLDDVEEQTKDSRVEGTEVEERLSFPYGQVHGDKDNSGKDGGFFIKDEYAPPDVKWGKAFKAVQLEFEGKNGATKNEDGHIAKKYTLVVLAFDHDEEGKPRTWRDPNDLNERQEGKIKFQVLCAIWEAWSEIKPFRLRFSQTNAIRMANMIRNFDRLIVGKATELLRKRKPGAKAFCRHFFRMPVTHAPEKLGSGKKSSWSCPIQDFEEGTAVWEGQFRKGVSVFKAIADKPENLEKLFIGGNQERVKLMADWIEQYAKTAVKLVPKNGSGSSDASDDSESFSDFCLSKSDKPMTFVGKDGTGEGQFGFMRRMLKAAHIQSWEEDVKQLLKSGELIGDEEHITRPNDEEGAPPLPNFTISGASKYIDNLMKRKDALKSERRDEKPEPKNLIDQDEDEPNTDPWDQEEKEQEKAAKPEPKKTQEPPEETEADDDADSDVPWE